MESFIKQNNELFNGSEDIATKLQVLANANRLRILCHLASGPLSVGEIEECLDMSQSAISQHLAKMKKSRILTCKKEAQTSYYYIEDERILTLMPHLHEAFCL